MKAYEGMLGGGGIAPRILDLDTRWRSVVNFTPRPLYPQGKCPCYPLDRRLGGPRSRSGPGSEEKNSQPLPGLETPNIQPVAQRYTTELSRVVKSRRQIWTELVARMENNVYVIVLRNILEGNRSKD
jgi:hypothetical protein